MPTAAATMAATWASSETSTVTAVAVPPAADDLRHRRLGLVGDHVGHHHPGPLGGEERGGHPADAATGPGDHGDLAVQSCHRRLPVGPAGPSSEAGTDRPVARPGPSIGTLPGSRTAVRYWSPCRPPVHVPSSGSPCTDRPRRGGRGSATPPWCPVRTSTWSRRPGARRCSCAAAGEGGATTPTPGRRRPGGRGPRRAGAHRRGGHRRRPLRRRSPIPATAAPAGGATSSSWACWAPPSSADLPVLAICRGMQVAQRAPRGRPGPAAARPHRDRRGTSPAPGPSVRSPWSPRRGARSAACSGTGPRSCAATTRPSTGWVPAWW